jgi:[acyl-carrier-protein] S-malonyltransferase
MMKLAAIFPGQGAQSVGMLAEIAQANASVKAKFDIASQVLDFDLWSMVQDGPNEVLGSTENTQPALLVASVALWELWESGAEKVDVMAGHSLGEYSALVCAGAMSFTDGVKLVRTRGELMRRAVPNGQGGMAAILGLDDDAIEACCVSVAGEVSAANFNAPGQVVIAGEMSAVDAAIEACKAAGAKRAVKLDVSGPFHSKLMASAADDFSQALDRIEMVMPRTPVLQNVRASVASDVGELKRNLVEQLYSPVQWTATVQAMLAQGLEQCVECGPGNVLAGLVKRISRLTPTIGLSKLSGLEEVGEL